VSMWSPSCKDMLAQSGKHGTQAINSALTDH
jgi:hypothetical protein